MYRKKNEILVPMRILLIEDDEDDFILIRDMLDDIRTNTFDVTWELNFDKSLEWLDRRVHDVCLLDYRLGRHNGLEVLEYAGRKEIDTPIIFLTGQGEYEVDVQAMQAGAVDYLVKEMLTPSLLERSIRYTLERARAARALQRAHDELEEKVQQRTAEVMRTNKELQQASEKIQYFAYSISHDLKSPIIGLSGLAHRLHDGYGDILDDRQIHWLEPERLPRIKADRLGLMRVLRNLLENALKHGGKKLSRITIGFEETDQVYILSVSDDGPGLKEERMETIFEPFERTGATLEGIGLGLAIVKEITERHGGRIWAKQAPENGAVFYFSISKAL
jgi:signal transduction histidine kinase